MEKNKKTENTSSQAEQIKILMTENKRLTREVAALKRELEHSRGKLLRGKGDDPHRALLDHQAQNDILFSRKRYFGYIVQLIKSTSFFRLYQKILAFFRRYALLSTTLKILLAILTVVQSSAIFVIATSASVVAIPFILTVSYAVFFLAHFHRKKNDAANKKLLANKHIVVFFPPKKRALEKDSFFSGMVEEFSHRPDHICIVVSPHFWRNRGLFGNRKPYRFSRAESESILLVRRPYYFVLKKKFFHESDQNMTEIY